MTPCGGDEGGSHARKYSNDVCTTSPSVLTLIASVPLALASWMASWMDVLPARWRTIAVCLRGHCDKPPLSPLTAAPNGMHNSIGLAPWGCPITRSQSASARGRRWLGLWSRGFAVRLHPRCGFGLRSFVDAPCWWLWRGLVIRVAISNQPSIGLGRRRRTGVPGLTSTRRRFIRAWTGR
jgi:hypothetical protein